MKACSINLQFATTISPKANLAYAEAAEASVFKRHHFCILGTRGVCGKVRKTVEYSNIFSGFFIY